MNPLKDYISNVPVGAGADLEELLLLSRLGVFYDIPHWIELPPTLADMVSASFLAVSLGERTEFWRLKLTE